MTADAINERLLGRTAVCEMYFACDECKGTCNLRLKLSDSEHRSESYVIVDFIEVSNLEFTSFGGGLTQVMQLNVSDISELQHDRINYAVRDLDDNRLSFRCREIKIA